MLQRWRFVPVLLMLGLTQVPAADEAAAQEASMADETAVKAAVEQWFVALNAMLNGDPAPLAALYSHGDDVTYMGAEGGYRIGWEATYADWKLQAEKAAGGRVEGADIHVVVGGELAAAQHVTKGEVRGPDGKMQATSLRETSVFRKEDGQWKMISHHADDFTLWEKVVDQP